MRLLRNVEWVVRFYPIVTIHRISARLCVFIKEGVGFDEAQEIARAILGVPGVARVSCGFKCERDIDLMSQAGIEALHDVGAFESFKVAARRNHTDFPINSMEMNALVGEKLCEAYPDKVVRMKDPDVVVGVEVVQNASYVYAISIPGVGGLPVGSSGKVVCLLSSGIDSPVALWRIARRGAVCVGIHFSGRPQTVDTSEYLVDDIAHVLERTGCIAKVYVVAFGSYQREIARVVSPPLRIIIYRRLMFKIAERIALRERARALVTGESLGQVASQTLENLAVTDAAVSLPVLRPLIGTDKIEIISQAEELGTFDISSQDAPDCCTLYMPRNPETHAKLPVVEEEEARLPLDEWIDEIVEAAEVKEYLSPLPKRMM